jgi:heat shock protein HslJ
MHKALPKLILGVILASLIASCATTPPSIDQSRLQAREWSAVSVYSRDIKEEANLTLSFLPSYSVDGEAGCNEFSAPVSIRDNVMSFGLISSSERVCQSSAHTFGPIYFAAMKNVRTWDMNADTLYLRNGTGTILIKMNGKDRQPNL